MLPDSAIADRAIDSPSRQRFARRQAERMVKRWNARCPIGTAVRWFARFGEAPRSAVTCSSAELNDAGNPVVDLLPLVRVGQ